MKKQKAEGSKQKAARKAVFTAYCLLPSVLPNPQSLEQTKPTCRVEQFAADEREQVGDDDDGEVAQPSLCARVKLASKSEPEERALGDGRERLRDEQVKTARRVGEPNGQDQHDNRIGAGGQPQSGEEALAETQLL